MRPRINLILYHGVLAPHCRWRAHVVAYRGAAASEAPVGASIRPAANDESTTAPVARYWAWADLMRRAFDIDLLACRALWWTNQGLCPVYARRVRLGPRRGREPDDEQESDRVALVTRRCVEYS